MSRMHSGSHPWLEGRGICAESSWHGYRIRMGVQVRTGSSQPNMKGVAIESAVFASILHLPLARIPTSLQVRACSRVSATILNPDILGDIFSTLLGDPCSPLGIRLFTFSVVE